MGENSVTVTSEKMLREKVSKQEKIILQGEIEGIQIAEVELRDLVLKQGEMIKMLRKDIEKFRSALYNYSLLGLVIRDIVTELADINNSELVQRAGRHVDAFQLAKDLDYPSGFWSEERLGVDPDDPSLGDSRNETGSAQVS